MVVSLCRQASGAGFLIFSSNIFMMIQWRHCCSFVQKSATKYRRRSDSKEGGCDDDVRRTIKKGAMKKASIHNEVEKKVRSPIRGSFSTLFFSLLDVNVARIGSRLSGECESGFPNVNGGRSIALEAADFNR